MLLSENHATNNLDISETVSTGTGLAGPVPHIDYCTPQCYAKGQG